jgi:hypothetical protein
LTGRAAGRPQSQRKTVNTANKWSPFPPPQWETLLRP